MDDVARLTEDVRRLTLLLADAQGERDALQADNKRLTDENDDARGTIKTLTASIGNARKDNRDRMHQIDGLVRENERLNHMLDVAEPRISSMEEENNALRAELDRLNPEPCAVCLMRPALPSRKTCEKCR